MLSVDAVALLALALVSLISGCSTYERNDPSLEKKCDELAQLCVDHPRAEMQECYRIGTAAKTDPDQQAQCFTAWDRCIDECRAYHEGRSTEGPTDAAVDAGREAGLDAATL